MATGTGSLKELREKRKMERVASEHGNSNKIQQGQTSEETGIHSGYGPNYGLLGNLEDCFMKVNSPCGPYATVPPIIKPQAIGEYMASPNKVGGKRRASALVPPTAIPVWDEKTQRWRDRGTFCKPPQSSDVSDDQPPTTGFPYGITS